MTLTARLTACPTVRTWQHTDGQWEIVTRNGEQYRYTTEQLRSYLAAVESIFTTHKSGDEPAAERLDVISRAI